MPIAYLGLGSNLGDRAANLWDAVRRLPIDAGCRVLHLSRLYEAEPVGPIDQPHFLNAAARVECALSPPELLQHLKRLETALGRAVGERWGPRRIDLDILLYGEAQLETPELTIPHRELWSRRFVLEPLQDVAQGDQALQAQVRAALNALEPTPRVWAYRPIDPLSPSI